jgi:hypothetical protein
MLDAGCRPLVSSPKKSSQTLSNFSRSERAILRSAHAHGRRPLLLRVTNVYASSGRNSLVDSSRAIAIDQALPTQTLLICVRTRLAVEGFETYSLLPRATHPLRGFPVSHSRTRRVRFISTTRQQGNKQRDLPTVTSNHTCPHTRTYKHYWHAAHIYPNLVNHSNGK